MAHIACADIKNHGPGIRNFHLVFINGNMYIRLMIVSVIRCIHFMSRNDIQDMVCFRHPYAGSIKRYRRICPIKACGPQTFPFLAVFHNTEYFRPVIFPIILLTKHKVIPVIARIKPAPNT